MTISTYISSVWTATDFGDPELSSYAESQLSNDTRIGIQAMAGLSIVMQLCVIVYLLAKGVDRLYLNTSLLFGLLSLHVAFSAAYLRDVRTLQLLGMAFLVIGALCLTSLAHQAGELRVGVMAATVMLFVAIPLVPWALRETSIVIGMSYLLLNSSLLVVPGRFDSESLLNLQLLTLGAATVALVVSGRNTSIRKHDLRARFELETARKNMELLSMQDHLTGAWNRRFLSENFDSFATRCAEKGKALHVAILDIDDFKGINDEFGHQFGDKILIGVADIFIRLLGAHGRLIRLGGDEFQIIYCGDDLDALIEDAVTTLQQEFAESGIGGARVITLSAGIVTSEPGQPANLEQLYKAADRALYDEKLNRQPSADDTQSLARTGTWKL